MNKILSLSVLTLLGLIGSFQAPKISWVAIGDSITYLNEHTSETGGRITKGYMTLVTEKLDNISYSNQGHNGWTSSDIVDSIEVLKIQKADVYSIFLGTNDWWQGRRIGTSEDYINDTGNGTFYGSFRRIIDKLRTLNNDARLILITPLQRADFVNIVDFRNNAWGSYRKKNEQSLADFAEAIAEIGKIGHFDVIDLYNDPVLKIDNLIKFKRVKDPLTSTYKNYPYPDFIDIPFNAETDDYPYPGEAIDLTYDGLHPSDKGYAIIADRLINLLKTYNCNSGKL